MVIHDYLYWDQSRSREESDKIFREAMGILKVPVITICLIITQQNSLVIVPGNENKQLRKIGLNRVASVMPVKWIDTPLALQAKHWSDI